MMYLMSIVIGFMNVLGFFLMKCDKNKALKHQSRISEVTFMFITLFGGVIGIIVGGQIFRHKTRKRSFQTKIVISFLASIVLYANIINLLK